jgi:hypothetical protein
MMNAIWKSNLGKLFLGGCGTQLGLVTAFIVSVGVILICSVCALSSVLSVFVAQEFAGRPVEANPELVSEATPNGEVEALRAEINALVGQVEFLQTNEKAISPPSVAPSRPKPFVIAYGGGIDLRSGPGDGYRIIGVLAPGSRLEIVGRNSDSSWWLISTPDGLAWVSAEVVAAYDVHDSIPVVTIPGLLVQPGDNGLPPFLLPNTGMPNDAAASIPNHPSVTVTPTAVPAGSRIYVEDTVGYKKLREHLSASPTSASFSPRGDQLAVIDGIKLYLVAGDGSDGQILLADDGITKPVGGAVWSPDGKYIAFVAEYLDPACKPCRSVGLVRLSDETTYWLQTPDRMDSDAPRWTEDGRLLVNVYPGEPADGATYVYVTSDRGQVASGTYVLGSSHAGQMWLPWLPGRVWRAGVSERPDTYYDD